MSTSINQNYKNYQEFAQHPLAPLFFQFINILKSHGFYQEAEDLLQLAEHYYLPRNRSIITKIIINMQRAAVSDEENRFEQLLQQL